MFWLGFLTGVYTLGIMEFAGLIIYAVKRRNKK